jgi:hypothetical protein
MISFDYHKRRLQSVELLMAAIAVGLFANAAMQAVSGWIDAQPQDTYAVPIAQIRQLDASGWGDAEIQAL